MDLCDTMPGGGEDARTLAAKISDARIYSRGRVTRISAYISLETLFARDTPRDDFGQPGDGGDGSEREELAAIAIVS
jgi:hypothetical protein